MKHKIASIHNSTQHSIKILYMSEPNNCSKCGRKIQSRDTYYDAVEGRGYWCEVCYENWHQKEQDKKILSKQDLQHIKQKWGRILEKRKISGCITCKASELRHSCQVELESAESWEIKKKTQLQKDLKELEELTNYCGDKHDTNYDHEGYVKQGRSAWSDNSFSEYCVKCKKENKRNSFGDELKGCVCSSRNKDKPNNDDPERERERERERQKLLNYASGYKN